MGADRDPWGDSARGWGSSHSAQCQDPPGLVCSLLCSPHPHGKLAPEQALPCALREVSLLVPWAADFKTSPHPLGMYAQPLSSLSSLRSAAQTSDKAAHLAWLSTPPAWGLSPNPSAPPPP